jgi:hypothetical protein
MYKLGHRIDGEWVEHSYPTIYCLPETQDTLQRIAATAPSGEPDIFLKLVSVLEEPYFLLYILHTPRGEAPAGRYQSPKLNLSELGAVVSKFKNFLAQDARFDLWAYSPSEKATVVWERHNLIYAYGPLERFATQLSCLGFSPGSPQIPAPHSHNYHAELDQQAKEFIKAFEWSFSQLH